AELGESNKKTALPSIPEAGKTLAHFPRSDWISAQYLCVPADGVVRERRRGVRGIRARGIASGVRAGAVLTIVTIVTIATIATIAEVSSETARVRRSSTSRFPERLRFVGWDQAWTPTTTI
ncbi:hypothetical protein Z043_102301, partial [Scleropages formosus]